MNKQVTTKEKISSPTILIILVIVLLISLILRWWGNGFGLPYSYHQDGARNVERSLRLLEGTLSYDVNPGWNILMFLEFGLLYLIGSGLGYFGSLTEFISQARLNPTLVETAARSFSGFLGTTTVLILFLLGRKAYNVWTGLVASLFLGLAFLHVRDSHYSVADVPVTFFITTSILFAVVALQNKKMRYCILAGLFGGFASATKWTSMALVVPLVLTIFFSQPGFRWRDQIGSLFLDKRLYLIFISFGVGFVLLGPQHLINPLRVVTEGMRHQAGLTFGGLYIDTVPGWIFYLKTLNWGLGLPLLVVSLAGIAWAAYRGTKVDILLLAFPILYYLIMGSTWHYFARYAISLLPFLAIFAGRILVELVDNIPFKQEYQRSGTLLFISLALVLIPAKNSIMHNILLTQTDTRTLAGDWFDSHVRAGAKIATEMHTPYFRDQIGPGGPFLPRRSEDKYKIQDINWTVPAHYNLEKYVNEGVDYIVTSSFITNLQFVDVSQTNIRQKFYKDLDTKALLVAEFKPYSTTEAPPTIWTQMYGPAIALEQYNRPGPVIKIYRLDVQALK